MPGSTAFENRKALFRFTAMKRSHSSSSRSRIGTARSLPGIVDEDIDPPEGDDARLDDAANIGNGGRIARRF